MKEPREGNPEGYTWAHNPAPVDFPLGLPGSTTKGKTPMANSAGRRRGKDGRFLPSSRGRGTSAGGSRAGGGAGSRGGGKGTKNSATRAAAPKPAGGAGGKGGGGGGRGKGTQNGAPKGGGGKNSRGSALALVKNPPRGGETATQVVAAAAVSALIISYKSRALEGAPAILDAGSDVGIGLLLRTNMAARVPWVGEYMHLSGNFLLGLGVFKAVRILAGTYVDKAAGALPAPKLLGNGDGAAEETADDNGLGEYVYTPGVDFSNYPDIGADNLF